MAQLSEHERAFWEILEAAELDSFRGKALVEWIPYTTPKYEAPYHLMPMAELFYKAETEGNVRALTSVPPRHAKTESILHFAAHFLLTHPDKTVGYATYAADIAKSKSKTCRAIAARAGVEVVRGSDAANEWRTKEGGGFLANGVGGQWTGRGVDLLIIDDPIKDREEAESLTMQRKLTEWATSSAFTRVEPNGSIIVNMTRWSVNDLIATLESGEYGDWVTVNMPAIDDEGKVLWPERWPLEALAQKKAITSDYDWASLFLGQPRPRGGELFREPARFNLADIKGARFAIACDPAASAKTSADYSAIVVVAATGAGPDQKVYVLEVWRGQVEIPELINKLRYFQERWGAPVYIESVGGFKLVAQMMRTLSKQQNQNQIKIVEVTPLGDKFTRALPVSAAWNNGHVLLPQNEEPWIKDFLNEVQRFTGKGDRHDDQVDALSHAFNAVDQRAQIGIKRGSYQIRYVAR